MKVQIHNAPLAGLTAALLLSTLSGCGPGGEEKKAPPPARVVAVPAEETRLEEQLLTTGDVLAMNTVLLKATVEGPISFCPWREGDRVEKDQKLIEIDRPLYRHELASAEAVLAVAQAKLDDLKAGARPEEIAQARESVRHFADCTEFAKADLNRIRTLVESGAVPAETAEKARVDFIKCQTQLKATQEQLDMLEAGPTLTEIAVAQATVNEAEARRNLAQAKLDECLIRAPFTGVVTEVFVRPGDLAVPRQSLLKIMEPDSLVVRTGLPENCAAALRTGSPAEVQLDAYPGETFSAKIERIYPRLESGSRTRLVELRITEPVDLMPRMFARVSVTGRIIENAVVIPAKAITATPRGDQQVFVAEQGKAVKRNVQTGLEQDGRVQILSGIKAGEAVIIEGNLNLKPGTAVNAVAPVAAGGASK
jgi:multidrug efflux pump subunit AcrA (membrane-fusion protein)